ncbi:MAG TPA: heparan-alpha-glucosaminide N-acetyltransferase domain-containing protein [Candidatus Bathyarchaeia archaeon]|nr:heparan-alpha-glucosaminide N-acetyltransferase domain-containing protein [Candidatus Bathyarchaeia archaeon]
MSASAVLVGVKRPRIDSVDVVRGMVMVLMALDHVRDFLGTPSSPTDLATTTVPLFFTRWVTHFCAPVFFLLTGTGAYLASQRKSKRELSRFLFTRGLWLIFLELVPLRCLGFQFNFDYRFTPIFILWALGCAMIVLSGLIYLPDWAITTFGVLMIASHNLLDSIDSKNPLWIILHQPGFLLNTPRHALFLVYPLIPWIGVTAAGYGLGRIYGWSAERRRSFLLRLGVGLIVGFVVLRAINVYGDPNRWSVQKSAAFTLLSFLNTIKYPPSLLFLLMTLGPAMLALRAFDGWTPPVLRPALTIGRVPMFYYILHIPLIHLIAVIICYVRYGHVYWMFQSPSVNQYPVTPPPGWGLPLPAIYLVWGTVVLALYPLCRWFARLKQRRSEAWLSYL